LNITIKHSQTEMDLVVIVDCDSASPNCRHLSLHYSFSSSFFAFLTFWYMDPAYFVKFFSVLAFSLR